jgi:hypothetical protein
MASVIATPVGPMLASDAKEGDGYKRYKMGWFVGGRMWFRVLPFLCLFLLAQVSRSQQKAIDVPFDNLPIAESPIEATGTLSVRETVVGNQVNSVWTENVVAKNISNKPIVFLVGVLDAVGPRSDGGYRLIIDRFFSHDVIQPGDTFPLATGTTGRGECCINPLDEARDPKAGFRVEFVQFLDGSTSGDPAVAEDALARRTSTLRVLEKLDRTYSAQGEQKFNSQLENESGRNGSGDFGLIQKVKKEKGTGAAISQVRKMLALGKERESQIGQQSAK